MLLLGTAAAEQEDVRSPHNYLLGTWARLGLVGVILVLGLLIAGLRLARLVAKRAPHLRDDDVLAMLLVASIPVVAFVGVVLESPFGALPYFWAIGHLSARACQVGAVRPFGVARGALTSRRGCQQYIGRPPALSSISTTNRELLGYIYLEDQGQPRANPRSPPRSSQLFRCIAGAPAKNVGTEPRR